MCLNARIRAHEENKYVSARVCVWGDPDEGRPVRLTQSGMAGEKRKSDLNVKRSKLNSNAPLPVRLCELEMKGNKGQRDRHATKRKKIIA